MNRRKAATLLAPILVLMTACSNQDRMPTSLNVGDAPGRGMIAIERYGCGSCHTIPFVRDADSLVGPPLERIAARAYIAGVLENTPENMARWIQDPPGVDHLTAMPNLRVSEADARDISAFLSTLR
jgi:cytochrome c